MIRGYHAEADLAALGRNVQALIAIRRAHCLPESVGVFVVSGADDFLLHVAVPDTDALYAVVIDRLTERPEVADDVNETLLDLEAIRPAFDRLFDDPAAMRLWFAGLITYSEALTLSGVYVPFTDIGAAVLRMLAATRRIAIAAADAAELTERFASMPPHPEVPAALRRLRDHVFRLFTLTDNTLEISGAQLEKAAVIDVFERRFSVDESVKRHKPAPEAYRWVADQLEADPADICLIACHVWDTLGALAAGWQAGLILRPGNAPLEVGPQPNYVGNDLDEVADQLIARFPAGAAIASEAV